MKKRNLALVAFLALAVPAAALYRLEQHAYRSPLYAARPDGTPRRDGLRDLQEWRGQKALQEKRRAELLRNLTTDKMVELGREMVFGKALCLNCHQVGDSAGGTRGPNLAGVGARAATRVEGLNDLEYLAQSLYQPDAFLVPGYTSGMTPANQPPIGLDDLEILMVVAYLQSLGAAPGVAPDTKLPYAQGFSAGPKK